MGAWEVLTHYVLPTLGGGVVIVAAIGAFLYWLMQKSIDARLAKGLETHKAQLKAQSDVEIERLRSRLNIAATEHEVRFSRLHEKRGEVIAETYSLLQELHDRLSKYVAIMELSGDPSREERRAKAEEAYKAFSDYYVKNLIFLPKTTARNLKSIYRRYVETFNEFVRTVDLAKQGQDTAKWLAIFQRVSGETKEALDELEDEFRRLLGDEGSASVAASDET
jgi:hypothetical protein